MDLSVIIVSYNVRHFLTQCLASVFAATRQLDVEVFVVDNASADDTVAYLEHLYPSESFPQFHLIANACNVGFGRANNQALCSAKGKYVLFLNPDTLLAENTLTDCFRFAEAHPHIGAMGVMMLFGNGKFAKESRRGFTTPWVAFCKMTGLTALFPHTRLFGSYYLGYLDAGEAAEIEIVSGAFMWTGRQALEKCGAFDERFFMYGEDIDLSYRLLQGGYRNYYVPSPIIHYKGESTSHSSLHYVYVFHKAMFQFYVKHHVKNLSCMTLFVKSGIFLHALLVLIRQQAYQLYKRLRKPFVSRIQRQLYIGRNVGAIQKLACKYGLRIDTVEGDQSQYPEPRLPLQAGKRKYVHVIYDMDDFDRAYVIAAYRNSRHRSYLGTYYPKTGTLLTGDKVYQL